MHLVGNGARFQVTLPHPSVFARARRTLASPFAGRAAARELQAANETLQTRYEDLDGARKQLDVQARQLRTALSINQVIKGDLDLQGFLGLNEQVRPGFKTIRASFKVNSEASQEQLTDLFSFSPIS